jgi:murein DD-endopeptidase MepM/ murein hydrolase activator NlpD
MAFVIWSRRSVSSQRVRFVEARTARVIAVVAVVALILTALALGVAIGSTLGRSHVSDERAQSARHSYELEELGKISATLTQIEPRVAQLSAQVGELRDFEDRLKASPKSADGPDVHVVPPLPDSEESAPLDGAGGPLLPPRLCGADRTNEGSAPQRLKRTQKIIDCLDDTLSRLQDDVLPHYASYMSYPGRDPAPGSHYGSPYGNRIDPFTGHASFHPGMDLVAPAGTAIVASAGGRVIQAGPHGGYGNALDIRHRDGIVTRYGHTSKFFVRAGDIVMPGQKIAEVGSTGRSTGPHLHFEVIVDGAQLNPKPYLALFRLKSHAQS